MNIIVHDAMPHFAEFLFSSTKHAFAILTQDIIVYSCRSAGYTAEWQRKVYFTFMTSHILIPSTGITYRPNTDVMKRIMP